MSNYLDPSLIEQFVAVTDTSVDVARSLLEACNGNLELAIGMHMDGAPTSSADNAATHEPVMDDPVRAPIPQKHEVLVEEQKVFGFRKHKRKLHSSVFDGFRDFQAEINIQENGQAPSTSRPEKYRRLEDLFRPPIDLLYKGSFHSVRDAGSQHNKWLLVNIQNVQEFACQVLNRDVWSNDTVRQMVRKNFFLWQVYHDSEEGKKFTQFYPVRQWPYIAIIDPRTGEKMTEWTKMDAMSFCDLVADFVNSHPNPSGSTTPSPPAKRRKTQESIIDTSEDSQLQAAIVASVNETKCSTKVKPKEVTRLVLESDSEDYGLSSEGELETFSGSDDEWQRRTSPQKTTQSPKLEKQIAQLRNDDFTSKGEASNDVTHEEKSPCDYDATQQGECSTGVTNQGNSQSQSTNSITNSQSKQDPEAATCSTDSTSQPDKEPDNQPDKWREYLGSEQDGSCTILMKFPDGQREQLNIPVTSQLRALSEFMSHKGFSADKYELLTHYPRKNLSQMDCTSTLKTAGLFPQETVFVHER